MKKYFFIYFEQTKESHQKVNRLYFEVLECLTDVSLCVTPHIELL